MLWHFVMSHFKNHCFVSDKSGMVKYTVSAYLQIPTTD